MNKKVCIKCGTDGGLTKSGLQELYPGASVQCLENVSFVKFETVHEAIDALQKQLHFGGRAIEVSWAEHAVDASMLSDQLKREEEQQNVPSQNAVPVVATVAPTQNVVYTGTYPQYVPYNVPTGSSLMGQVPQPLVNGQFVNAQLPGQNGMVVYQPPNVQPFVNQMGVQPGLIPVTVTTVQGQPATTGTGLMQPNNFIAPQYQIVPIQQAVPHNNQPQPPTTVGPGPFVATGAGHFQQTNGQVLPGTSQPGQQQPYGQQGEQQF